MNQNTISRRQFLGGLAMGTGVVFLAACAPAAAPAGGGAAPAEGAAAAPAGGGATLTWWDYMGEAGSANGEAVMDQVAKYNAAQSAVTVERTFVPFGDLKQKLLQGAAAGQLPDLVIIDNPDHSSFASLGVLADITDPITAWGKSSDYFPGPWDSTVYQGKNYGIPDNSNCLVQWQNKAFTEPAGITAPTNWDELRAAAAALTEGERFGIALSGVKTEEGTFQWLPFLWMTGEDLATLDSDGGRAAMQLWVDLVQNGNMSPGILNWTQGDVKDQFVNGLAALMVNGPWQIPVLKSDSPDLNWEVAVLPAEKQGASILGGENMAIVKSTSSFDDAWDLLIWRQEPENLKEYLVQAGKLPSLATLATDEAWTTDPVIKVFMDQLQVAKPRNYGPKYPEISNAVQEMMQAAVSGQKPVDAAVAEAAAKITPLLPS
ncbi:MAG: sugar ABC transporter substrate-binding protein [Caldilineaceae bacterium]|nr:sugar ABC transporter substrate-binding protein [Caldilineaceae bacterium]HRW50062.1 sugar ABC transporter substrate-binding protein [Caldilinea sp.]